ncbi:MAG: response regulator, partial [Desulfovibrio sp.]|nr:response regulator [Desulfovibrio sp.]
IMQMIIVLVTIAMIFAVYSLMHARRREIEMQRIKAEEVSRSKSAFLSHMSHDIRTPMNAIIGFTDLSLTKQDINVVHDYLQKIKLSSNHLLSLINDVLEMSRIESGKVDIEPIPVSIPELLHNLSTIILGQMEAKQHSFDLNALNVRNENILCDKLRLNQILLNLLSNAIKYTPAGGVITFTVSQLGDAENGYAKYEFRVKDNGMGMTKEFAAKIFEAFEREQNSAVNKIQGTGLGMAITKHLVDLMGGEITVETEKDKGSEFILNFQFPILTDQSPIKKLPELKGMHVLVVDDEYGSCDAITSILTDMEVRSEWTMFGKEAILRNADAAKRGDPFKVCIIDWKMPDMSGIKVASEVIHTEAHPAVILVTAYDWMNIKEEAVEAGIKAFCNKPVFASELAAAFEVALNAEAEKQENVSEQESMDFSGKRVLLVDDIEVNREISTAMLEMKGILVEYACNGQEAVEKVQAAEPGYYDVVLMDVQMPIMDGYQATKAIRALPNKDLARVPIVAMTANAFDEDRQAALAAGMDGHVAKPIDVEKLFKMLKDIL